MVKQWPYDIRYDHENKPGIGNRYIFTIKDQDEEAFDPEENTSDYSYKVGEPKLCDGEFIEW